MATILIIDSQAPRRSFLGIVLEQRGHRVLETDDGQQALGLMRQGKPDLVLLDVLIAPPGGHQFLQRLCAGPDRQHQPRLVFLAAPYVEAEARLLAGACGVTHVIPDIADTDDLHQIIQQALAPSPAGGRGNRPSCRLEEPLYQMVHRLQRRVLQLETLNAQLERQTARHDDQLAIARTALDEEVLERLHTRDDLLRENQRLRSLSVRDPLTGLYNRRYLEESLVREEGRAKRSGRPLSMMMIDIDNFKQCNDTYGHAAGDKVLQEVSRCMKSLARSEDILCRYGGEEFVMVMTNTAPETLWQRANALRTGVPKLHIEHEHRPIGPITLSIGLAIFPDNGTSARAALQAADAALYHAKTSGRDRIVAGGPYVFGLN